jgi:hypothetical protein
VGTVIPYEYPLLRRHPNPLHLTAFAMREKCKARAFIFPYRCSRSDPEPEGFKGGKKLNPQN